jgi:peptidoglycan/LPS O-acetylase OafA/YrhL
VIRGGRLRPARHLASATPHTHLARLQSLELLRAAAALLVVLFHAQTIGHQHRRDVPFHGVFSAGYRGVDLFFVLSGFIIAYVYFEDAAVSGVGEQTRFARYAFKRLARIFPAVEIMTILSIGVYWLGFGGADKTGRLSLTSIVASALLLPQPGFPLVNVTWTLTYEMFFYLLFGVTLLHRSTGLALLLLWQVVCAVTALAGIDWGPAGYYFRPLCLDFGVGLACAWWLRHHRPASRARLLRARLWRAVLALGIAGFLAAMSLDHALSWAGMLFALAAGMIVISLVRLEQAGAVMLPRLWVGLGAASYSIYLVHFSVITLLVAFLSERGIALSDLVCLASAAAGVAAGVCFDGFVDRPIQRWLRNHTKRREPPR